MDEIKLKMVHTSELKVGDTFYVRNPNYAREHKYEDLGKKYTKVAESDYYTLIANESGVTTNSLGDVLKVHNRMVMVEDK